MVLPRERGGGEGPGGCLQRNFGGGELNSFFGAEMPTKPRASLNAVIRKRKISKHDEIWRDTSKFGLQPSHGRVPFVPQICPVCPADILSNLCGFTQNRFWKKGSFWKRGLFKNVHCLEYLENLEIFEVLEIPRAWKTRRKCAASREFRDFRDSRGSSSEKTPFIMTPFSGPRQK